MEDTKKCSKCRKVKPVGEFGEYKQCSSCLDDYCKLYSKNNPGKRRDWARENVEKTKELKQTKVHCDACKVEIQRAGGQNIFNQKTTLQILVKMIENILKKQNG